MIALVNTPFMHHLSIAFTESGQEPWQPIPDLSRTDDASVTLFILEIPEMEYSEPVNGPLFAAHNLSTRWFENGERVLDYYASDEPTAFLACAEQFQFLNNANNAATAPSSLRMLCNKSQARRKESDPDLLGLNLSTQQQDTTRRLIGATEQIGRFIMPNDAEALRASKFAPDLSHSVGLGPRQWVSEVDGWFERALALQQLEVVRYATKDVGPSMVPHARLLSPKNGSRDETWMCDNQIMKSTGSYQTFSVLGMALVGTIGMLVAIVSWGLEAVVFWVRGKKRADADYKSVAWEQDSMFSWQRAAFEAGCAGDDKGEVVQWEKQRHSDVPVTCLAGEVFGRAGVKRFGGDSCGVEVDATAENQILRVSTI
ncbi:hypothetical protein QBC44DRAFT_397504 [Cladorrhinum sp. PSN332]|nr:hypothetical protein QBC44DRAFT_397504 [Cladorrhinum sp. PSN332]